MGSAKSESASKPAKAKGRRGMLLVLAGAPLLFAGAGGAAYMFVPAVSEKVSGLFAHEPPPPAPAAQTPMFVNLPEMSVTLPNGGDAKELRIRISVELANTPPAPH